MNTKMTIPIVRPSLPSLASLEAELSEMLSSGRLTNFGIHTCELESKIGAALDVPHVASVANATTGLMLLLNTLPAGSEVLVPSFTFLPTVQSIVWNRLKPVFVDVSPIDFTIAPEKIEAKVTRRTSAILAVHTFGNPCRMDDLQQIADRFKLKLFFDAAHALGSRYRGKPVGRFGDAEVFSLNATKLLPCGEGGLIVTRDETLYKEILDRRNYGFTEGVRYDCRHLGLNAKITEFSALLGIHSLPRLETEISRRNEIASRYRERLSSISGIGFQQVDPGNLSNYKDFVITLDKTTCSVSRDRFIAAMDEREIETHPYFWPAVHEFTLYRSSEYNTSELTMTMALAESVVSLPIFSSLSTAKFDTIITAIQSILKHT